MCSIVIVYTYDLTKTGLGFGANKMGIFDPILDALFTYPVWVTGPVLGIAIGLVGLMVLGNGELFGIPWWLW